MRVNESVFFCHDAFFRWKVFAREFVDTKPHTLALISGCPVPKIECFEGVTGMMLAWEPTRPGRARSFSQKSGLKTAVSTATVRTKHSTATVKCSSKLVTDMFTWTPKYWKTRSLDQWVSDATTASAHGFLHQTVLLQVSVALGSPHQLLAKV